MSRRVWDRLTPTYQRRLQRGGIDRTAYERGELLKAARGHSAEKTPEHPTRRLANPFAQAHYEKRGQRRAVVRVSTMEVVGADGRVTRLRAASMSKQDRSRVGLHWNAMKGSLSYGDASDLGRLAGKSVSGKDASGQRRRVMLMASPDHLDDVAARNPSLFSADSIYRTASLVAAVA
jgi:hypothetical protein